MNTLRTALLVLVCVGLAACSGALRWDSGYHTVRSGETIYSIAHRYKLDQRDLAAWNNLGDGSYIRTGQRLRLTPPAGGSRSGNSSAVRKPSTTAAVLPAPPWQWPATGQVSERYGQSVKSQSGIRIAGTAGAPVRAAAAGEVVYAGTELRSYGQLLIIKHNDTWLTAYGFLSDMQVAEGQRVAAGETIALMGADSRGTAQLHFEIRRNGKPVDPLVYLPQQ